MQLPTYTNKSSCWLLFCQSKLGTITLFCQNQSQFYCLWFEGIKSGSKTKKFLAAFTQYIMKPFPQPQWFYFSFYAVLLLSVFPNLSSFCKPTIFTSDKLPKRKVKKSLQRKVSNPTVFNQIILILVAPRPGNAGMVSSKDSFTLGDMEPL